MRLHLLLLSLAFVTFGCGSKKPNPVPSSAEIDQNATVYDDQINQTSETQSTLASYDTCIYETKDQTDKCQTLRVNIRVADASTGRTVSRYEGRARESVALAVQIEASSSRYENDLRDQDRFILAFRDKPQDFETQIDGTSAAILWTPESVTSGSFEIVFRDVGRCIVEEAYSSKGVLDEDIAEDCEDADNTKYKSYETVEDIRFTIEKSEASEQRDAALSQIDAACKSKMLGSIVSGAPALFSGGGITSILGVGMNAFASQAECDAQKKQIENQFIE